MKIKMIRTMVTVLIFSLTGCAFMKKLDEKLSARAHRLLEGAPEKERMWRQTIYEVIYMGMPLDEFQEKFGSHIFKDIGNMVYFYEPETKKQKARATFIDGRLAKYERYGILGNWSYGDISHMLRKFQNDD